MPKLFHSTAIKGGLALAMLGVWGVSQGPTFFESPVRFVSWESQTLEGDAVHNEIRWFPGATEDVWMMNQSHQGGKAPSEKWDRLAIVIDKRTKPGRAQFLQLPPGPLEWSEDLKTQGIKFRVSCFMCHTNGPRAVRPLPEASSLLSLRQKAQIAIWNWRIRSYGRLVEHPDHARRDSSLEVPFRHRSPVDNEKLAVASCTRCHDEESGSFKKRNSLTRQNAATIDFMVKNGLMPPRGSDWSEKEKQQIQRFLKGF